MEQGKIVKGIAGFYYVDVVGSGIYECKAKGIFRKQNQKPFVGDDVRIAVTDRQDMEGNIVEILPRKNELARPPAANVDQALVIFAAASPKPNLNLLDRFLLMMEWQHIPAAICFNKCDLVPEEDQESLRGCYAACGYPLIFASALRGDGTEEIRRLLAGRTTTVAGPSGVGKSTLINLLAPEARMETGEISEKIQRGRHTTRHVQLIPLGEDTYIFDTPGFSSLSTDVFTADALRDLYPEFAPYAPECRFAGCSHIHEPDCAVREALADGKISRSRYENYVQIYAEVKNRKQH